MKNIFYIFLFIFFLNCSEVKKERFEDYIVNNYPTKLFYEKANFILYTGYTYRYDITINNIEYIVFIRDRKIIEIKNVGRLE